MAKADTTRGRDQNRAKVAGRQDHEVKYEAGKNGREHECSQVDREVGWQQP